MLRITCHPIAQAADIFRGIQMCARSGDVAAAIGFLNEAQVCILDCKSLRASLNA